MEASRRLDELEVIKRKIPSGESVLMMAASPPEGAVEINITPEEWRILVLVDGRRSVADIAKLVGLDEFGAMRVLYGLVSAGLIEVAAGDLQIEVATSEPGTTLGQPASPEPEPVMATEPEPMVVAPPEPERVMAEPEPVMAAEPERVMAEPEPVMAAEPERVMAEPVGEPVALEVATAETQTEATPAPQFFEDAEPAAQADIVAALESQLPGQVAGVSGQPEVIDSELLSAEPVSATSGEGHDLGGFGFSDEVSAPIVSDDTAWNDDALLPLESFDQPGPNELITAVPTPPAAPSLGSDPFMSELFGEPSGATTPGTSMPAEDPFGAPPPPADIPVASQPPAEAPELDRAAVVRELAGLFSEDERPRQRSAAPPKPSGESAGDAALKRVEDDDQVTKGLISRLIDGVKGL
jgi:hypothetical protein